MATFVTTLLTFSKKKNASDRICQKQANQFKCRGMLKYTCIFNVNGTIIAMHTVCLRLLFGNISNVELQEVLSFPHPCLILQPFWTPSPA